MEIRRVLVVSGLVKEWLWIRVWVLDGVLVERRKGVMRVEMGVWGVRGVGLIWKVY